MPTGHRKPFIEKAAFRDDALNEIMSGFHTENGYAVPNRFEVIITPPKKWVPLQFIILLMVPIEDMMFVLFH